MKNIGKYDQGGIVTHADFSVREETAEPQVAGPAAPTPRGDICPPEPHKSAGANPHKPR